MVVSLTVDPRHMTNRHLELLAAQLADAIAELAKGARESAGAPDTALYLRELFWQVQHTRYVRQSVPELPACR
ncbi:MAG: hypothetical protein MN733_24685 [Nitrososphaera sp.]|nr:hypothetical protein [Nitrososphaera sp.]